MLRYNLHPSRNVGVSSFVASELFVNRMFGPSHFRSWPGKSWAMPPTRAGALRVGALRVTSDLPDAIVWRPAASPRERLELDV